MKKTVCGFGDKVIFDEDDGAEEIIGLKRFLKKLLIMEITQKGAEVFMTGREGEFENLFASVVRDIKNCFPSIKLVLVEPRYSKTLELYKDYYAQRYDSIQICSASIDAKPKDAVLLRNKWMVDNSYFVFTCVRKRKGDAYIAMKHAERLWKNSINFRGLR